MPMRKIVFPNLHRGRLYNDSEFGVKFPDSRFAISDRWMLAHWMLGNNYKSLSKRTKNDEPFYGSYPPGYLKRLAVMFPDAVRVIHLFSGSLTREQVEQTFLNAYTITRVDSKADRNPDLVADAESFYSGKVCWDWRKKSTIDLIAADPPYSKEDAEHYGAPLCNKKKVFEQCHLALRVGGVLCWMDQALPMFAKRNWNLFGIINMVRSTNHRVRNVFFFEKV
jgi:hypothetical protein